MNKKQQIEKLNSQVNALLESNQKLQSRVTNLEFSKTIESMGNEIQMNMMANSIESLSDLIVVLRDELFEVKYPYGMVSVVTEKDYSYPSGFRKDMYLLLEAGKEQLLESVDSQEEFELQTIYVTNEDNILVFNAKGGVNAAIALEEGGGVELPSKMANTIPGRYILHELPIVVSE